MVAAVYAWAVTGLGILVASFVRTQIEALLITMILTMLPAWLFSGFFSPVANLSGAAWAISVTFPTTYFLHACVAVVTKGLSWGSIGRDALALSFFAVVLNLISLALMREQAP